MLLNILIKKDKKENMIMFEVESTANLQSPHSKSLRTTIPSEVVKALHLSVKDTLNWTIAAENDEMVITVSKK